MKTSKEGRALIKAFEGLFLKTYVDAAGVLTIGYGHTSAAGGLVVKTGQTITESEADKILADDLVRVEERVMNTIKVPLKQYEFDALVSFDFNTGAIGKGTVDDKLNKGDRTGAMNTLLQYEKAGGRVLKGLTRRRQAEKLMFEGRLSESLKLAGAKVPVKNDPIIKDEVPTASKPQSGILETFFKFLLNLFTRKN